jgi:DNA invertase Pin-like site-specific DNA recombinase
VLDETAVASLRGAHGDYDRARSRTWLERVRVGLEYRRAMREVDESVAAAKRHRDAVVRAAVAAGGSYREVARALGLSHSRIQQIVNADRRR